MGLFGMGEPAPENRVLTHGFVYVPNGKHGRVDAGAVGTDFTLPHP